MNIRNIAIIAHVDHGKTTMVDGLLKQSGTFRENQQVETCVMDSNELERERGITILSKCTSVNWHGMHINIVDTPGHADFGGEVERILSMVDGVILLVDASEGPMPQTKFVLGKALKLGLCPIVVINKVDKPDARCDEVLNEIFDLFVSLDANDKQLDFPVLYASGRSGWAVKDMNDEKKDLTPLFELICSYVPEPDCQPDAPFSMLATTLEANKFIGRLLTGKVQSGTLHVNDTVKVLNGENKEIERVRISKILAYRGLTRDSLEVAHAGDIIAVAGVVKGTVADTICALDVNQAIKAQPIDPPTLAMTFSINDSPLSGREGDKVTSRMIWDRLCKEAEGNIALKISRTDSSDSFEVAGRGALFIQQGKAISFNHGDCPALDVERLIGISVFLLVYRRDLRFVAICRAPVRAVALRRVADPDHFPEAVNHVVDIIDQFRQLRARLLVLIDYFIHDVKRVDRFRQYVERIVGRLAQRTHVGRLDFFSLDAHTLAVNGLEIFIRLFNLIWHLVQAQCRNRRSVRFLTEFHHNIIQDRGFRVVTHPLHVRARLLEDESQFARGLPLLRLRRMVRIRLHDLFIQ